MSRSRIAAAVDAAVHASIRASNAGGAVDVAAVVARELAPSSTASAAPEVGAAERPEADEVDGDGDGDPPPHPGAPAFARRAPVDRRLRLEALP